MDQEEKLEKMVDSQGGEFVKDLLKLLVVVAVIALGVALFKWQMDHPVEAAKVESIKLLPKVTLMEVMLSDYPVKISTQGRVEPKTRTMLISEVGGQLEWVSPKLKTGEFFEKGEEILRISPTSYDARLSEALAQVADAKLSLELELARAEQSMRDWKRLGRGGDPEKLVTREPQLARARAKLAASEAAVVKARKELEMTSAKMPYAARVEEAFLDQGAYLAPGGQIAQVYAADRVELRLPLSLENFSYLPDPVAGAEVEVMAEIGNENVSWHGKLVRTEGRVDPSTLTMTVVVEIAKEEGRDGEFALPPVGLFVQGVFQGKVLPGVAQVKRAAIRGKNHVWVCNADDELEIREVEILHSDHGHVVIGKGLKQGERIVVSPIELPVAGMRLEPVMEGKEK